MADTGAGPAFPRTPSRPVRRNPDHADHPLPARVRPPRDSPRREHGRGSPFHPRNLRGAVPDKTQFPHYGHPRAARSKERRMRHAWLNGRIIPGSEAVVSIYDSAMMYGDHVFEMTRTFNRKRFLNEEHLDRLERSMVTLHLRIPYRRVDILNAQDALDRANAEDRKS